MAYEITYPENITTVEDVLRFKGYDLNNELTSNINDVGDKPAERAINDVEEWLIAYINLNFDFTGDRSKLSGNQRKCFVKAVCEQIDYIIDNSDVRNLAGLNADAGIVIDSKVLEQKELSPSAFKYLRMCGLANLRRF